MTTTEQFRAPDKFFVHYTVKLPPKFEPQKLVAGPYTEDEVLVQRRDISGYAYVHDVFVSTDPQPPK